MKIIHTRKIVLLVGSLLLSHSCFSVFSYEDEEVYKQWSKRYEHTHKLPADVTTITSIEYDFSHACLQRNGKPLARRGETYLGETYKKISYSEATDKGVCYIGKRHTNYVQYNENPILPSCESYGVPQEKEASIDKGEYSRNHPEFVEVFSISQQKLIKKYKPNRHSTSSQDDEIVFDPGHGVDHAFTLTYKGTNSTQDVRNFTPQSLYYNRSVRNYLASSLVKQGGTYKEIAIYPEHPLSISREFKGQSDTVPLPVGFLFITLDNGNIVQPYYFPNLINYKKLLEKEKNPKDKTTNWKWFANYFRIPDTLVEDIWGHEEIKNYDQLRKAMYSSEFIGYRALSGRYEIPLDPQKWDKTTRNAFVRTAALYKLERAAEYDQSVENMVSIAGIFNDDYLEYEEFEGKLYIPELAKYWVERALKEIKRKGYDKEDIFYLLSEESRLPLDAQVTKEILGKLEQDLGSMPQMKFVKKLIEYYDDNKNVKKVEQWSQFISQVIQENKISNAFVVRDESKAQLKRFSTLKGKPSIVIEHCITDKNIFPLLHAFGWMIKNKCTLDFIEFKNIEVTALNILFQYLENGFREEHESELQFLDVRGTAFKFPQYDDRATVRKWITRNFSATSAGGILLLP